jgi:catechol 2,3-dioxygenase-like lactoylglutathione lyase family enzyme
MINKLDHLIVSVKNIAEAEKNYSKLFGTNPVWRGEHKELGTINSIFNFNNTYFELLAANGEGLGAQLVTKTIEENGEGLTGIVLGTEDLENSKNQLLKKGFDFGSVSQGEGLDFDSGKIRRWKNLFLPDKLTRGLFTFLIEHTEGELPEPESLPTSSVHKLDHVVINTNDPDGFIDVYQNIYGLRLALDQTVEKWGGRMLFFRLNHTTIEVIGKNDDNETQDKLWGLAWDVKDLEATHKRLEKEGFEITPLKEGRKPNTLVATVKSNTHNIPTLLIEHLAS